MPPAPLWKTKVESICLETVPLLKIFNALKIHKYRVMALNNFFIIMLAKLILALKRNLYEKDRLIVTYKFYSLD